MQPCQFLTPPRGTWEYVTEDIKEKYVLEEREHSAQDVGRPTDRNKCFEMKGRRTKE